MYYAYMHNTSYMFIILCYIVHYHWYLDDDINVEDLIDNDFRTTSLDFAPFKSKIHALVYLLMHSPRPIVS